MAFVAVDKDGQEGAFNFNPNRKAALGLGEKTFWQDNFDSVELPKGSIKKLIGRTLTWADEPVELKKEEENGKS